MTPWLKIGLFLSWTFFVIGSSMYTQKKFDQAAIAAAIEKQQQYVIKKERKDQTITEGIFHGYETHIIAIDRNYAAALAGVRDATGGNGLPAVPSSKPGHNGAACAAGLSKPNKTFLIGLAKQADEQTARLIACQAFIKDHQN